MKLLVYFDSLVDLVGSVTSAVHHKAYFTPDINLIDLYCSIIIKIDFIIFFTTLVLIYYKL